jgi:hypothetical protein
MKQGVHVELGQGKVPTRQVYHSVLQGSLANYHSTNTPIKTYTNYLFIKATKCHSKCCKAMIILKNCRMQKLKQVILLHIEMLWQEVMRSPTEHSPLEFTVTTIILLQPCSTQFCNDYI